MPNFEPYEENFWLMSTTDTDLAGDLQDVVDDEGRALVFPNMESAQAYAEQMVTDNEAAVVAIAEMKGVVTR